jgi:DNA-binding NarL/FixJ family response regulator
MDLQMPVMDGLEATRRLHDVDPDARVIIVTQYGDAHLREAATQAGALGYVLKENLIELRQLICDS